MALDAKLRLAENNLDLLRLAAALQVAVLHVSAALSPRTGGPDWLEPLRLFPGVPIFFFISGLLISHTYERAASLRDYTRNRALRIFPALHVCVLLNLGAIACTGYFAAVDAGWSELVVLYLAKTSFLQFYNPDFMRAFGNGVLNGSLWTICVELQFYVITPLLYALLASCARRRFDACLLAVLLLSLACNRALYALEESHHATLAWKLARVSFLPWLYMFLTGVLVQRNFELLSRFLGGAAGWVAPLGYAAYALALHRLGFELGNELGPLLFFPLAWASCALAYQPAPRARRLLGGYDLSYGVYIYHVPVMNIFLHYGLTGSVRFTLAALALSLTCAFASWVWIERPCLLLKRGAARPLSPAASPCAARASGPQIV